MRSPLAREHERVTAVFFYGIVLLLGYLFLRILTPFFAPLGWAAVVAIFVYPWHEKLVPRYGNARAAALSTLVVTVLIVGPGLVILMAFVQESRAALSAVDRDAFAGQLAFLEQAWNRIRALIPGAQSIDLRSLIDEAISRTGGFLAARVGGLLADILVLLFQLFLTLFALFFFLRDANAIMRDVRRALPFEDLRSERMIRQTRDLVYASIAAGLVIASLQGFAGGLVFALLDLGAPVFWGVMMGFLALFPFVGTWMVWVPAAIWLIATGQVVKGAVLARTRWDNHRQHRQLPSPSHPKRSDADERALDVHQSSWRRERVWAAGTDPGVRSVQPSSLASSRLMLGLEISSALFGRISRRRNGKSASCRDLLRGLHAPLGWSNGVLLSNSFTFQELSARAAAPALVGNVPVRHLRSPRYGGQPSRGLRSVQSVPWQIAIDRWQRYTGLHATRVG